MALALVLGSVAFAAWIRVEIEDAWKDTPKRSLGKIRTFGKCTENGQGRIPANLEEALTEVDGLLDDEQRALLRDYEPLWWHRSLGAVLRNCWGLWGAKSPLGDWFRGQGISHPDDMSGIVLRSLHRRLGGKEIELAAQITHIQASWRKAEEEYQKGTNSGRASYFLVGWKKEDLGKREGWVHLSADNVPHMDDLVKPLKEQGIEQIEACWKRFPKTTRDQRLIGTIDDRAVETQIRIRIAADGLLVGAEVAQSKLPPEHAWCLANALLGISVPAHQGASYVLRLHSYRYEDPK